MDALLLRDPRRARAHRASRGRGAPLRHREPRGLAGPLGDQRPRGRACHRQGTRGLSRRAGTAARGARGVTVLSSRPDGLLERLAQTEAEMMVVTHLANVRYL